MEYKYPEDIEIIIQNIDKIKNNCIYYNDCLDNCESTGNFIVGQKAILKYHITENPRFAYYLDFGEGYVSDWFSEKEIEYIAGEEENLIYKHRHVEKPPLGVTPIHIFERQRIIALSRALYEYINFGNEDYELLGNWANELSDRIYNLKKNQNI